MVDTLMRGKGHHGRKSTDRKKETHPPRGGRGRKKSGRRYEFGVKLQAVKR